MTGLIGTLERQLNEINRALEETARIIEEVAMPRAAPTNPVFLSPEPVGREEGEVCRRDGCEGTIEYQELEGCSCHINPPCVACENLLLECDTCGLREDDDEW